MVSRILGRTRSYEVVLSELRTAMEVSSIYGVLVPAGIMRTVKARVSVKPSAVSSAICQVMYRTSEIEEEAVSK